MICGGACVKFRSVVVSTANRSTLRRKILYYPHMRIFLAGAAGAIGRRLTPLLVLMGHEVTGTTRSADKAGQIEAMCGHPVVVDVFNADALTAAVIASRPDVVIHQLTDLPSPPGTPSYEDALRRNARLRIEGTRNLMAAAQA